MHRFYDGFKVQFNFLMKGALKCDPVVFQSLVVYLAHLIFMVIVKGFCCYQPTSRSTFPCAFSQHFHGCSWILVKLYGQTQFVTVTNMNVNNIYCKV